MTINHAEHNDPNVGLDIATLTSRYVESAHDVAGLVAAIDQAYRDGYNTGEMRARADAQVLQQQRHAALAVCESGGKWRDDGWYWVRASDVRAALGVQPEGN
jgi:hypothetical protein